MASTQDTSEKWYVKYAWLLLCLLGIAFALFAVNALLFGLSLSDVPVGIPGGPEATKSLAGTTWDELLASSPGIVNVMRGISRVLGSGFLGFSLLVVLIAATSYRQGQRWAWFALWYVPIFLVALTLHELRGSYVFMPIMFLLVAILGLLLPFRTFFPRK
jgi:hypothetical protein